MSTFEKEYYESDEFWKKGMVEDSDNLLRIKETIDIIPSNIKSLVDIGCGNGVFAKMLRELRPEIKSLSIDRSESALRFVETPKMVGDIKDLPLENKSFDCVTCLQVLEHIPFPVYEKVLFQLSRIAKKNIIVSVPYNEKIDKNVTSCPKCFSIFNVDLHLRKYTDKDISELFNNFGFKSIFVKNIIKKETFVGIEKYASFRSLFKVKEKKFNSPICPVCGYVNSNFKTIDASINNIINEPKDNSVIKSAIKKFWPKKILDGYWIISVYEKI